MQAKKVNNIHKVAYFTIPLHSDFGELVKSTRKSSGLDQQDVVDLVKKAGGELSLRSYSSYERGESVPKLDAARWILLVLGLIGDEQVDDEGEVLDLDMGPGGYKKELRPMRNEQGKIEFYIKAVYTTLTIEEAEAEKRADGAG